MEFLRLSDAFIKRSTFKILSGAIHYFELTQLRSYHSLYNLKALVQHLLRPMSLECMEPVQRALRSSGRLDEQPSPLDLHDLRYPLSVQSGICDYQPGSYTFRESVIRPSLYRKRWIVIMIALLGLLTPYQVGSGGPILMMQAGNEPALREDKINC